ncbi:dihydroxyacetone kinase family protein [Georgenia sp. SUBG003]|uniref:dihydroxyacetone kinase family protein n=1 Tax=Georgenia sp. SUBG003 TaxID=1497974 RepID=UPI003AB62821
MTRLFNDPKQFADDALAGMALAYPGYLQGVHGGVVRATESPRGSVSVVIGGGSGHYPAFAGWVGPGLAHGAVCGNVFASPSASQVCSVTRAADNGGGTLLMYGNYAGDVLHFGQAAERLRSEGLDVRTLAVSDDVASNTPENHLDRRGVTGDLVVFKVAGAAAERGDDLDRVERLALRANERTRSLGVAFHGCTLPGADEPLFTVPSGMMSVGLGVHGEPGVRDVPMGTAAEIADLLVEGVLAEEPRRGQDGYEGRAVVILNGLGTIKNEELFVVYRRVAQRLEDAGVTPVLPEVGEMMSSLDMAGLSLTVTFLDAELEALWSTPVDTIAFRRGAVQHRGRRDVVSREVVSDTVPEACDPSRELAQRIAGVLAVLKDTAVAAEPELGRMDAIAGDGDHGQGMSYGSTGAWRAATEALARTTAHHGTPPAVAPCPAVPAPARSSSTMRPADSLRSSAAPAPSSAGVTSSAGRASWPAEGTSSAGRASCPAGVTSPAGAAVDGRRRRHDAGSAGSTTTTGPRPERSTCGTGAAPQAVRESENRRSSTDTPAPPPATPARPPLSNMSTTLGRPTDIGTGPARNCGRSAGERAALSLC